MMPGTDGLPSMAGLPPIITFVEIEAPGTGSTVAVVQGLEAGEGGTGQVVGFAEMSPAQRAGEPPTMTVVCFGKTTTGPAWQQVMTAETLTSGGTGLSLADAGPSIAAAAPRGKRRSPTEALREPVAGGIDVEIGFDVALTERLEELFEHL